MGTSPRFEPDALPCAIMIYDRAERLLAWNDKVSLFFIR